MYDNNYYFEPFSTPVALTMLLNLYRSNYSAKCILRDVLQEIDFGSSRGAELSEDKGLKNSYIYINFDMDSNVNGSWLEPRRSSKRLEVYR